MKKIFLFAVFALLLAPGVVLASDALGTGLLTQSAGKLGLEENLESSTGNVIKGVLVVTGTMFLILTVAAGIMWMLAAGNDERIGKAKKIIIGSAIGLFISLFAYTITSFVASRISGAGGGDGDRTRMCTEACVVGAASCSVKSGESCATAGAQCCSSWLGGTVQK